MEWALLKLWGQTPFSQIHVLPKKRKKKMKREDVKPEISLIFGFAKISPGEENEIYGKMR